MNRRGGIWLLAAWLGLAGWAAAGDAAWRVLTPEAVPWPADSRPDAPAMAVLSGDPQRPGPYTVRYRLPAGLKLMPHWHPDTREVVVLSGSFRYGYGETFDPARMYRLGPGSYFVEPAGQPHFAWTPEGEVILQASGHGPSGTTQLPAAAGH